MLKFLPFFPIAHVVEFNVPVSSVCRHFVRAYVDCYPLLVAKCSTLVQLYSSRFVARDVFFPCSITHFCFNFFPLVCIFSPGTRVPLLGNTVEQIDAFFFLFFSVTTFSSNEGKVESEKKKSQIFCTRRKNLTFVRESKNSDWLTRISLVALVSIEYTIRTYVSH